MEKKLRNRKENEMIKEEQNLPFQICLFDISTFLRLVIFKK